VRTYAHLGDQPLTYENWMTAIRSGHTFVTIGPLIDFLIEGVPPGDRVNLPSGGGALEVAWRVESVNVRIEQIEIIAGGTIVEAITAGGSLSASGATTVRINGSTWIALRVRGSYRSRPSDVAAHSSAVQIVVGGAPLFSATDAATVIEQIEGTLAFVDTLAPRSEVARYRKLRVTLEAAHRRLHDRMHRAGVAHQHQPLHSPYRSHEH
jgi:hypothetical protein